MRATEIEKRPVVTMGGDAIFQVKDVVYGEDNLVVGFTLAGRGLFAGPSKQALPWSAVRALGPDAVVVADADGLVDRDEVAEKAARRGGPRGGRVLGSRVLTDSGTDLGEVTDVVVEVEERSAALVGYQIKPTDALGTDRHTALIPIPAAMAVSGENLIVPAVATEFVSDDLAGFGASVEAFRARLNAGGRPGGEPAGGGHNDATAGGAA